MTLIAYLFASTATILWAASGVYLFSAAAFQEVPQSKEALRADPTRMKPVSNDRSKTGDAETRQSLPQIPESERKASQPILADRLSSPSSNAKTATSQTGSAQDRATTTSRASGQFQPTLISPFVGPETMPGPPRLDAASRRPDSPSEVDGRRSHTSDAQATERPSVSTRLAPSGAQPPSFSGAIPPPDKPLGLDASGRAGDQARPSPVIATATMPPFTTLSTASDIFVRGPQPSAGLSAAGPPDVADRPSTTASIPTQYPARVAGPLTPAAVDSAGSGTTGQGLSPGSDGHDQPPAPGGARHATEIERNRSAADNPFGHIKRKVARKAPRVKDSPVGVATSNLSETDAAEPAPSSEDEVTKLGPPIELTPRVDHSNLPKPSLKRRCPAVLKASDDFSDELVELCRNWARRSAGE
jgi:hypothetical protein